MIHGKMKKLGGFREPNSFSFHNFMQILHYINGCVPHWVRKTAIIPLCPVGTSV